MRKILLILFLLTLGTFSVMASHILGGEITYIHIKDLKYKVSTVIYRDCNGCKLMGAGGGESTQDCGKIDLFLATADASSCGRKNVVKLNLERKRITELLPVCSTSRTKCQTNSTLPFGVEAHYFESEIDFNDYTSFRGCGFEIYTNISWRTKGISTIDDDQTFYNYAYINPWLTSHNSPDFKNEISPIIYCKQPYYYSHAVNTSGGDSLSYHLVAAKSDYNKDISYKTGYSAAYPLDVYCSGCTPDETSFPTSAFNFNPQTGDIAFTPVNCGQTAVIVLEIRKWVKASGVMELLSVVRRDIQYIILNSAENNPPQPLLKSSVFEVCAGDELTIDISFEDKPFKFPDETYGPKDSLRLTWDEAIEGATLMQQPFPEDGKYKAIFKWNTDLSDVSKTNYRFTVYANDGACPLNAVSSRSYEIRVIKPATVSLEIDSLECAYREIGSKSDQLLKLRNWTITSLQMNGNPEEYLTETALFKASGSGRYEVHYQAEDANGCNVEIRDTFEINPEDFHAYQIQLSGDSVVCAGESLKLIATLVGSHKILKNRWLNHDLLFSDKDSLLISAAERGMEGDWQLITEASLNNRACIDTFNFNLTVHELPKPDGNTDAEACLFNGNLNEVFGVTLKGDWISENPETVILNNLADISRINRSIDQSVIFTFITTDTFTQCRAERDYTLLLKTMPELEMEDVAFCKGSGNFYIDNLAIKPASRHLLNLSWVLDADKLDLTLDPTNQRWFVPSATVPNGTYKIVFTQTGNNGCHLTDSAELTVLDNLKIGFNEIDSICGGKDLILSQLMDVFPKGGGWYCADNTEYVRDNVLLPEACGNLNLSYTYDKYGCYDRAYIQLYVECLDPIQLNNTFSQVCTNYSPIVLNASPMGGMWSGSGVNSGIFNPNGLEGNVTLTYSVNGMICKSDSSFEVNIVSPPSMNLDGLPSSFCEDNEWNLRALQMKSEQVEYTALGEIVSDTSGRWISYKPAQAEKQQGKAEIAVKLSNAGLCGPLNRTISAKISQKPSVTFPDTILGCEPAKLKIQSDYSGKNDPAQKWKWSIQDEGVTSESDLFIPVYTYSHPGTFDLGLELTTEDQCVYIFQFPGQVRIYPSPVAMFESDPDNFASQMNPVFNFSNRSSGGSSLTYLWNFGTGRSNQFSTRKDPTFVFPYDTGKYLVSCTTTNEYGCTDEATKWIEIGPDIKVFIPNAFTPDGKGPEQNSKFRITASGVSSFHITIINRVGGIVYQSDNINDGWDGTQFGKLSAPGVYVYDITLISNTGKEYKYSGTLNLLR